MEFRQARRRIPRRKRSGFSPALIWICAVFFAAVYLISASRFGTWLAESVVAPAILNAAPVSEPTPRAVVAATPSETADDVTTALPAIYCYAVQIGVYAERENAEKQSASLRELGAAGYIVEDDGRFRVLAAGYPDRAGMQQVCEQLKTSGVDSLSHEIAADGVRLHVGGTAEKLGELEEALSFTASLPERLSEAAIRFDKESMTIDGCLAILTALRDECTEHGNALDSFSETELRPIADYLRDVAAQLSDTCEKPGENTVRLSSLLKRLYLSSVFGYMAMTERMDNA